MTSPRKWAHSVTVAGHARRRATVRAAPRQRRRIPAGQLDRCGRPPPAAVAAIGSDAGTRSGAPMLLSLLVAFCLVALVFEAGDGGLGPRAVAVLGVLVATNSVLRFVEVAV